MEITYLLPRKIAQTLGTSQSQGRKQPWSHSSSHWLHTAGKLEFRQGNVINIAHFIECRALPHSAHLKAGENALVHGANGRVALEEHNTLIKHMTQKFWAQLVLRRDKNCFEK